MKKLVNILACLVFVFLLTSVSFAKSKNTEKPVEPVSMNLCTSSVGSQCDNATALAMSVSYQALVTCASSTASSAECTTANNNAAQAQRNADYICKNEVQPVTGPEAVYSPAEKKETDKTKILNPRLSFREASAR